MGTANGNCFAQRYGELQPHPTLGLRPSPPWGNFNNRVEGTAATVAIGIANGADIMRVHDVREMVRVCRMSDAILRRQQIEP